MKGSIGWQKETPDWPHTLSELTIDTEKTALLIVDVQNNSPAVVYKILPNIVRLRNFFRQHKLLIVYIALGTFLPDGRDRHIKRRLTWHKRSAIDPEQVLTKEALAYQIRDELQPLAPDELVIDKNSGGAFNSSAMDHYLSAMAIQNVVVCGIATHGCVENTARDAADRGYNVILAGDACATTSAEGHRITVHTFCRLLGSVKSTSEVLDEFSRLLSGEQLLALKTTS
ncbi:MAG: cysteine hydrolase [Chloroflexi bacterium]|nr:cysteine hydrolase [Chloroflexota bacterium]